MCVILVLVHFNNMFANVCAVMDNNAKAKNMAMVTKTFAKTTIYVLLFMLTFLTFKITNSSFQILPMTTIKHFKVNKTNQQWETATFFITCGLQAYKYAGQMFVIILKREIVFRYWLLA